MRPVTWDSNVRFDDPNLYWGEPSYLLEYGDPGWVYDPSSASQPPATNNTSTHRKRKTMPKLDYISRPDEDFSAQLTLFKNNIGSYSTLLGLTTDQVTAQANDANYFAYVLAVQDIHRTAAQQWTVWKDSIRDGGSTGTPPAAAPLPTAVTAVAPGVETRFRNLVKLIKSNPNYNTAMGEALGIEGAEKAGPDFSTFKPQITLEISGGQVIVRWNWQGYASYLDLIEICVDRGAGYQLVAYDSTPNYTDTTPFPSNAALWKYKAIYRVGDQRVGQWSDEVSITVAA